jgi:hypothetical protein
MHKGRASEHSLGTFIRKPQNIVSPLYNVVLSSPPLCIFSLFLSLSLHTTKSTGCIWNLWQGYINTTIVYGHYLPIVLFLFKTQRFGEFFLNLYSGGWNPRSTRHCGHQWPIVPAPSDYDEGEIRGMIGRGNRSTWRKPAPVPLCPPQTLHAARTRTRAATVGSQRLTAWATARPTFWRMDSVSVLRWNLLSWAESIEQVVSTWGRRQNPVSETLCIK